MAKNFKLIKGVAVSPLKKLNESSNALKNPDKYVFLGVFTQCSTPDHKVVNRNGRIYQATEVLRHLGYLRDLIKENSGRLLGELDHPEGRFDVSMKEASHMITDLWYDDKLNCVMGRLEVLDTPNGKTLKELIDAGYPLYVSSRAAGDVNEKTHEVEIAQIFTYDVVCTPGFKEARLERVDESVLTDKALKYINESISNATVAEKANIEIPASAINESILTEFANTKISDVNTPLLEEEEMNPLNDKDFFPIMKGVEEIKEEDEAGDSKEQEEKDEDSEKEESENDENADSEDASLSDEEKAENREMIISVKGVDKDGEVIGESDEEEENDDIVDVKAISADDDSEDEEESEETEEESKEEEDSEETEEDETHEEANEAEETDEAKKIISKTKKDKIKSNTDKDMAEIDSILNSVNKAEAVKESIIRRYPFTISLSESNFAKFASLRPKLKKRCADFIEENEIFDIRAINELWTTPLREDKKVQQNWLKLASQSDIDLYVAAPIDVQNAIEESAKYVILDTQEDVDNFWARTGLRQQAARKLMNEQMIKEYQQTISENAEYKNNQLGYDINFIKMTENWFNQH